MSFFPHANAQAGNDAHKKNEVGLVIGATVTPSQTLGSGISATPRALTFKPSLALGAEFDHRLNTSQGLGILAGLDFVASPLDVKLDPETSQCHPGVRLPLPHSACTRKVPPQWRDLSLAFVRGRFRGLHGIGSSRRNRVQGRDKHRRTGVRRRYRHRDSPSRLESTSRPSVGGARFLRRAAQLQSSGQREYAAQCCVHGRFTDPVLIAFVEGTELRVV